MENDQSSLWDFHSVERISYQEIRSWMSETVSPHLLNLGPTELLMDCQPLLAMVAMCKRKSPKSPREALLLIADFYSGIGLIECRR